MISSVTDVNHPDYSQVSEKTITHIITWERLYNRAYI